MNLEEWERVDRIDSLISRIADEAFGGLNINGPGYSGVPTDKSGIEILRYLDLHSSSIEYKIYDPRDDSVLGTCKIHPETEESEVETLLRKTMARIEVPE